jgi:hypothetical protein
MGLDCSHNAWHGGYISFMHWRKKLAEVAGLPPLELMDGFFTTGASGPLYFGDETVSIWREKREALEKLLPISWDCLKPSPLHELLYHSDCEGEIASDHCGPIADALEALIPLLPDEQAGGHICRWREKTQQFVDGLRAAAAAGEALDFH